MTRLHIAGNQKDWRPFDSRDIDSSQGLAEAQPELTTA